MDNSFATVWQRILGNADKPFLMPNGREFHYVIEEIRGGQSIKRKI